MALFKGRKTPKSALLGSTLAQMLKAKQDEAAAEADIMKGPDSPTDLPEATDPDILEMQRQARRAAKKRKGLASTILGGQLGDEGYSSGTLLG